MSNNDAQVTGGLVTSSVSPLFGSDVLKAAGKKKESILCFRDSDVAATMMEHEYKVVMEALSQGVTMKDIVQNARTMIPKLDDIAAFMLPRDLAEEEPMFRQLIPYVMVISETGKVLCYRRSKASGENRLHDMWSVGIGGHINLQDAGVSGETALTGRGAPEFIPGMLQPSMMLDNALFREMDEELGFNALDSLSVLPLFTVRVDDNPVDSVHLGVILAVLVSDDDVSWILETKGEELDEPAFLSLDALPPSVWLETWSQLCIEFLSLPNVINTILTEIPDA